MPEGMETMATAADLKRLLSSMSPKTPMGNQLKALEIITKRLKGKALFVDTLSPPGIPSGGTWSRRRCPG